MTKPSTLRGSVAFCCFNTCSIICPRRDTLPNALARSPCIARVEEMAQNEQAVSGVRNVAKLSALSISQNHSQYRNLARDIYLQVDSLAAHVNLTNLISKMPFGPLSVSRQGYHSARPITSQSGAQHHRTLSTNQSRTMQSVHLRDRLSRLAASWQGESRGFEQTVTLFFLLSFA